MEGAFQFYDRTMYILIIILTKVWKKNFTDLQFSGLENILA